MMDWTDRHCRVFHRLLTRRARLYTEMVTADAVMFGPRERLLGFDAVRASGRAAAGRLGPGAARARPRRIGADFGYDEINLNCGCPSRPRAERPLRRLPDARAGAGRRMRGGDGERGAIPVTVKCRIGVDEQEPREALFALVDGCRGGGRGGGHRPCPQGLARGPEPEGQPRRSRRSTIRWSMQLKARASRSADRDQRRRRRSRRGARASAPMSTAS